MDRVTCSYCYRATFLKYFSGERTHFCTEKCYDLYIYNLALESLAKRYPQFPCGL